MRHVRLAYLLKCNKMIKNYKANVYKTAWNLILIRMGFSGERVDLNHPLLPFILPLTISRRTNLITI